MKKIKKLAVLLATAFIFVSLELGVIGAAAEIIATSNNDNARVYSYQSRNSIQRSSAIVSSTEFEITKTSCSAKVKLKSIYSGNMKAVVQQNIGGTWSNYLTICDENFSPTLEIKRSISCSLPNGSYRISLSVTANGSSYSEYSSSVTVS